MLINVIIGVIQVFASIFLIVFILLHSGRGSGLSDMFGGAGAGGALAGGTVVERNLDRMTIVVALIFTFSSVFLALRLDPEPMPAADSGTGTETPGTAPGDVGTPTESLPVDVAPPASGSDAPASAPASPPG